jgi:hypothetical protein
LALARPDTPYLFFVLPFFAVGAGFVVGTGIRTAVIFASTPRRLPATAAALNQSSLIVGAQAGIAGVTAVVATAAVSSFNASVPAGVDAQAASDGFRSFLEAVGTSEFGQVIGDLSSSTSVAYGAAFAAGVQTAMLLVGLAALVGAALCWLLMPDSERVTTTFELREEGQPAV